jgi:flagellin-like protein
MERLSIRKDDKAVSPVIAVILMVAITVVLAGVLYVWVTSLSETGEETTPTVTFKLTARDVLNDTVTTQDLVYMNHQSGDNVKWADMKFQISDDGGTYYIITFTDPVLGVAMSKGPNIGDDTLFEAGETVYFAENSANWNADKDFYIKIVHNPSKSTMYEDDIDLI